MTLADFPEVFQFLFTPCRYKSAYGGRGSGKSWSFARALLLIGAKPGLLWPGRTEGPRILCARETMKSLSESVHQLLEDQIRALGLDSFYRIEKAAIYGANGTQFSFTGLKHNVAEIRSFEGADIVWVEEGAAVSKHSWDTLIPTVRRENSEIWCSWNPMWEDDPTYELFVTHPPPNSIVRKVNFDANPFFPEVLRQEMEHMQAVDPDGFSNVWLGNCINLMASSIYANELRAVDREGRIRDIPYDPARPVDCYWDLGYGDMTAVWMVQAFPFEYRCIDYIEDSGRSINWFLQAMQSRGYLFGSDWLPWDLGLHASTSLGSGKSIEELMRLAGRRVRITPKLSVADGINAARTIFPLCWFDRARCEAGIRALRHYRYGENKTLGHVTREPIHDASSHGADAFRYFAVNAKPPKPAAAASSARLRGERERTGVGTWT